MGSLLFCIPTLSLSLTSSCHTCTAKDSIETGHWWAFPAAISFQHKVFHLPKLFCLLAGKKLCSVVCCLQASVCNWYSLVGSRTYIATSTILPLSSSINHGRRVKIFLVKFEQLLALICKISLQIPKRDKKCHWANLCAIGKYIDDVKLLTKLVPVASYKSTFKWEYSLKDGGEKYLLFDHPDHLEWALKQMFEQMWGWHRIIFPLYNEDSLKQSAQKESMAW